MQTFGTRVADERSTRARTLGSHLPRAHRPLGPELTDAEARRLYGIMAEAIAEQDALEERPPPARPEALVGHPGAGCALVTGVLGFFLTYRTRPW